jgi:hypothetical protein
MVLSDNIYSLEPQIISEQKASLPEPCLASNVSGKLRIPNLTSAPRVLKRNEHFCKVRSTFIPDLPTSTQAEITPKPRHNSNVLHSDTVIVDPDTFLSEEIRIKFKNMLHKYDSLFNPHFSGYNGAVVPLEAKVNMGPVQPPQRKGRVQLYSKDQLVTLQEKFD